jgi:PKD repeat protein
VDDPVTLDGTGSTDPDGNLPLAYGWQQSGGPLVTLSDLTAAQPTFTAPAAPTVLTFTLWVTDALGMVCDQPDTVVITVADRPIAGLLAFNDSPTVLGNSTDLWATVASGTNVIYTWDFGSGANVSHTYPAVGWYTATVTATNSANSVQATTLVSITEVPARTIYLPLVLRNYAAAPDLTVERIVATTGRVQVVIANRGAMPVEAVYANEFWVDLYVDPDRAPDAVNETWRHVGSRGAVWGVTIDALPLDPGQVMTLTVTSTGGDPYYRPDLSALSWPLAAGTPIYAQVDSAHTDIPYGAIYENHEIVGAPYENNILGPTVSTTTAVSEALPPEEQIPVPRSKHLPSRP